MMSSKWGCERVSPWPKMIRLLVRVFAPSTVMAMGMAMYALPIKLEGPLQMPAPPTVSPRGDHA